MTCFTEGKERLQKLWRESPDLYLEELKRRFSEINPDEFHLSYSGGRDSHFLLWFITNFLGETRITIVAVNTKLEHAEIRERMYKYADVVLMSSKSHKEIKEEKGIPCFTKFQDEYIYRYQGGLRSDNCLDVVHRRNITMNLNKKASELLLSGKLHKISNKCCNELKKKPLKKYQKESGRKSIMGVMAEESQMRKNAYNKLFTSDGRFTPIFDMTKKMLKYFEEKYHIPIPKVYNYLDRTGCMGCPYGRNIETELSLLNEAQRNYTINYFKDSYEVKGIDINKKQENNQ